MPIFEVDEQPVNPCVVFSLFLKIIFIYNKKMTDEFVGYFAG